MLVFYAPITRDFAATFNLEFMASSAASAGALEGATSALLLQSVYGHGREIQSV